MHEYHFKFFNAKERYGHLSGPTVEEVDALLISAPYFSRRNGDAYEYDPPATQPGWSASVHVVSDGIWLTLPEPLGKRNTPFEPTFSYLVRAILATWGGLEICEV